MNRKISALLTVFFGFLLSLAPQALAIPTLQLDIVDGWYDKTTETIMSSGSSFTLYAFLIPDGENDLADTYYISAALVPQTEERPGLDLGSFKFGHTTVQATSGMVYGTPPLGDSKDLPDHGIFPTYFQEFKFHFSSDSYKNAYNTEDKTTAPGIMYSASFEVDTTNLASPYAIHFDLYHYEDGKIVEKAPFSHDAESSRKVPEPGTMLLLGFGLGIVGAFQYSKNKDKR